MSEKEVVRGERGKVGEATAGLTIKQMWFAASFVKDGDTWVKTTGAKSLKQFARELVKAGDKVAASWLAHKSGSLNQPRSENSLKRIGLESAATKAARRGKK